jgi:hypothetical protein
MHDTRSHSDLEGSLRLGLYVVTGDWCQNIGRCWTDGGTHPFKREREEREEREEKKRVLN